jgi:hypothetical protein
MKEANPILEMSYRFALEVMSAAKAMRNRKEYDLASQFWRAGTSIRNPEVRGKGVRQKGQGSMGVSPNTVNLALRPQLILCLSKLLSPLDGEQI